MNPVKKILILSANPKDRARLRLSEEVRAIEEGLRRSKNRDRFVICSQWAVRLRDLRRALLDHEPQIVHFCGHGDESNIIVEDEQGMAVHVPPESLAGLFKLFKHQVECVLLNACYSQTQAEAINQYIPYVIGMSQAIHDKAAIEFSVGFYDALGANRSIEEAFAFGQNAIQLFNLPDHLAPVLLGESTDRSQISILQEDMSIAPSLAQSTPSNVHISGNFEAGNIFGGNVNARYIAGRDIAIDRNKDNNTDERHDPSGRDLADELDAED